MEVSPEVVFENDYARVVKVTLEPGASLAAHEGEQRVIYSLSDYPTLYEAGDEEKEEKSFKKGDVHWHDACLHALENTGETEAKYLVVSYKD